MTKTIFRTPTEFDLSVIDIMGVNVKPNTPNPIGHFGTGLKYAIAVLLREGAILDLYTNGAHYHFYLKDTPIRGKVFKQCRYRKEDIFSGVRRYKDLPFTTEFGKDWQLWMAFRELYSNTIDENGECLQTDTQNITQSDSHEPYTAFVVDHYEFGRIFEDRHNIFLDPKLERAVQTADGEIVQQKNNHVYYRGLRAFDLPEDKPSIFTYNIKDELPLTEDRTIKSQYSMASKATDLIASSTNRELIKQALLAPEKTFEASLDYTYAFNTSNEFKEELRKHNEHKNLNYSARKYYSNYLAPPPQWKCDDKTWAKILEACGSALSSITHYIEQVDQGKAHPQTIHNIYTAKLAEKMNRNDITPNTTSDDDDDSDVPF